MTRFVTVCAIAAALGTAAPALAQNVDTPENVGPVRNYDVRWNGYYVETPYAYAPGESYAYAPRGRYVYEPAYPGYGYWVGGRFYNCTQSYTPNRPDRSAGGSNV